MRRSRSRPKIQASKNPRETSAFAVAGGRECGGNIFLPAQVTTCYLQSNDYRITVYQQPIEFENRACIIPQNHKPRGNLLKSQTRATFQLIDFWVGNRLHHLRRSYGYSVEVVASAVNLPEEQLQDIERGHARISMNDLHLLCRFFNVTVTDFFDDAIVLLQNMHLEEAESPVDPEEGLELIRYFARIKSPEHRQTLLRQAEFFSACRDEQTL